MARVCHGHTAEVRALTAQFDAERAALRQELRLKQGAIRRLKVVLAAQQAAASEAAEAAHVAGQRGTELALEVEDLEERLCNASAAVGHMQQQLEAAMDVQNAAEQNEAAAVKWWAHGSAGG